MERATGVLEAPVPLHVESVERVFRGVAPTGVNLHLRLPWGSERSPHWASDVRHGGRSWEHGGAATRDGLVACLAP
jgi:hypothetical protein